MKHKALLLATVAVALANSHDCLAQKRGINGNGFDSGDINIVPKTDPAKKVTKKVTTIQLIAVSPKRVWKSSDPKQKPITGSLLAFERESKTGKVRIVQEEKVRLLVGKKNFTVPLAKLSPDDRIYVHKLVDSARVAGKLLEPATDKKPRADAKVKPKKVPAKPAK